VGVRDLLPRAAGLLLGDHPGQQGGPGETQARMSRLPVRRVERQNGPGSARTVAGRTPAPVPQGLLEPCRDRCRRPSCAWCCRAGG